MQMVSEIMTRNAQFVRPQENLQRAAQIMDELNVGSLPVCDGEHLVGMVTDRDITVRGTAAGLAPAEAHVEDVMSGDVRWCFEDQSLDEVMRQMEGSQIRRVPVVSHDEQRRLVGIVALGDIATRAKDAMQQGDTQQLVEKISSPSAPDRARQGSGMRQGGAAGMGGTSGAGSDGSMGYEGDVGLAGAGGATSNAMGGADEASDSSATGTGISRTRDATGGRGAPGGTDAAGTGGASGGVAGTTGGAAGADLG